MRIYKALFGETVPEQVLHAAAYTMWVVAGVMVF